jgi:hypothetical protein
MATSPPSTAPEPPKSPPSLRELLEHKYSLPHFILLWELRDATGFDSSGAADAVAVSLYATRGRAIHGIEIKASRSDWLAEVKRPDKAERIGRFCDYFFLAADNDSVAKLEEIPPEWGFIVRRGAKLKIVRAAQKLQARPLDREIFTSFLYATMKRFSGELQESIKSQIEEGVKQECGRLRDERDRFEKQMIQLRDLINKFEHTSGVSIRYLYSHPLEDIGAAVRRVLDGDTRLDDYRRNLESLAAQAERFSRTIHAELEAVKKAAPVKT